MLCFRCLCRSCEPGLTAGRLLRFVQCFAFAMLLTQEILCRIPHEPSHARSPDSHRRKRIKIKPIKQGFRERTAHWF